MKRVLILFVVGLLLPAAHVAAQTVPSLINYQGQVLGADGNPLATGDYTLTFQIFDTAEGGTLIWGPQVLDGAGGLGHGPKIPVVQGYFNVMLGPVDTAARPLSGAFQAAARFLEIKVGTNNPISPRQQVLSAPYALNAANAASAANVLAGGVNTPALTDGAVTTAKLSDSAVATTKLADSAVISAKLADSAVISAKLADGAVTGAKLSDGAVAGAKVVGRRNLDCEARERRRGRREIGSHHWGLDSIRQQCLSLGRQRGHRHGDALNGAAGGPATYRWDSAPVTTDAFNWGAAIHLVFSTAPSRPRATAFTWPTTIITTLSESVSLSTLGPLPHG
jgi:hypothetical protein